AVNGRTQKAPSPVEDSPWRARSRQSSSDPTVRLGPLPLQSQMPNLKSESAGGHSSMVEPQIVVLVVAGSSPVDHPIFLKVRGEKFYFRRRLFASHFSPITLTFVPVAQLDRASDF